MSVQSTIQNYMRVYCVGYIVLYTRIYNYIQYKLSVFLSPGTGEYFLNDFR